MFICDTCGISFTRYFNLQRHSKQFHNITLGKRKNKNEQLPVNSSNSIKNVDETKLQLNCPVDGCEYSDVPKNIAKHFDVHNIKIEKTELAFNNVIQFKVFPFILE